MGNEDVRQWTAGAPRIPQDGLGERVGAPSSREQGICLSGDSVNKAIQAVVDRMRAFAKAQPSGAGTQLIRKWAKEIEDLLKKGNNGD
jgi:hypothetical protein